MNKIQKVRMYGPRLVARSFLWPISTLFRMSFFYSEYKAVEKGIRAYNRDNRYSIETKLRRNIHRLEKGLINKKPKSVFGLAYISETISSFKKLYNIKSDSDSIKWAEDIISLYFQTIDFRSNKGTLDAHNDFTDFCKKNKVEISGHYHPYELSIREKSNIEPEHLKQLFQQRRSIRSYTSKKVDRSIIEKALDMGLLAPSGCNRQPFEFQIIDNDSLLEKISMIPPGSTSFAGKAPAMIFVFGNLNAYYDEKDRHMIYIDSAMAVMSFILALESFGVSSCVINFPEEKSIENKLRKAIKMEPYQKCIMALTIGYPSDGLLIPSSMKKNVSSVIKYN